MPVKVHVTRMLVRHMAIQPDFSVEANDLEEMLDTVDRANEGFRDSICDETGTLRTHVNIFVNGENFQHERSPRSLALKDGDEIYILANVAGGLRRVCNSS